MQPLTDEIAARANVFSHQRDGIIENVGIGDDLRDEGFVAARTAILYDLSPDTSIQLAGDYEDRSESPGYSIGVSQYAYSTDPYNSKAANDVYNREENRDMYGVSLQGRPQLQRRDVAVRHRQLPRLENLEQAGRGRHRRPDALPRHQQYRRVRHLVQRGALPLCE